MLIYVQSTGTLALQGPGYTKVIATGYSGYGDHKNNPDSQCFKDLGPIPRGDWTIGPPEDFTGESGAVMHTCMRLSPKAGTDACGRKNFWIHGGNAAGTSSQGCIVLKPNEREAIVKIGVTDLRVIAAEKLEGLQT